MLKYVILFKNERSKLIEMIQTIFYALVNKQLQNEIVTSEDEKIYRYGYILLFEVILNLIIALVIGMVLCQDLVQVKMRFSSS